MQSHVVIDIKLEEQKSEESHSEIGKSTVRYSLLRDSMLAKYAGNTATLFSVCDAVLNTLTARLENINYFMSEQVPFYVMGLYYFLPFNIPLFPYIRHRWLNQPEMYDPDAIELLAILQDHDEEFARLVNANPKEKAHILEILTSYLRYEKNQPFSIVINLILLTLRAAHGILIFTKELELGSQETHEKLNDWAALLSSISNITYLAIVMLHNNFQKYHFSEKRNEAVKNNRLQKTFFSIKNKLKNLTSNNVDLSEPLLSEPVPKLVSKQ